MTSRLMLRGTEFREEALKGIDCPLGIFLDLYPLDKVSDDPAECKKQFRDAWFWSKMMILRSIPFPVLAFGGVKAKIVHAACAAVYGAMALLLLFRRDHRWWVVLLGSAVLTTVLELAASYLLERMGLRLWDYSAWPLQFEGRISVLSSLVFGVLALALVGGVHPLLRRFYEKAPVWLPCTLGIACGLLLAGGSVYVFFLK